MFLRKFATVDFWYGIASLTLSIRWVINEVFDRFVRRGLLSYARNASAISPILADRRSGFFSNACVTRSAREGGMSPRSFLSGSGLSLRCCINTFAGVGALK